MSYTIWDEAHDRFCAVQDEWNTRQGGWVPDSVDERAVDEELSKQMQMLDREVQFYESRPEIGGRSARDQNELDAAKVAFINHLEAAAR